MKRLLSVWPCDVSVISSHTHTHTLCVRRSALSHWDVLFQGSLFFGGGMFAAVLLFWPTSCQRRSSTPHRRNFSFQTDTNGMSLDSRTFLSRTWLCVCVSDVVFAVCRLLSQGPSSIGVNDMFSCRGKFHHHSGTEQKTDRKLLLLKVDEAFKARGCIRRETPVSSCS